MAAQEPGEDNILAASYGKISKDVSRSAHLLPFFGTDYGLCRFVLNSNVPLLIKVHFK